MIPILRADFSVCQTYRYEDQPPLGCPITVFGGADDDTKRDRLEPWREQTASAFNLNILPGDHFFIQTAQRRVLEIISRQLRPLAGAVR
jgi:surfactin synthase thioesterase subunit